MSEQVDVHIHLHLPPELATLFSDRQMLCKILANTERLIHMGESLSQQVDDINARLSAALPVIQTDITAIAAELSAGIPPAGSVITQAQVDALNANVTKVEGVATALGQLVAPTSGGATGATGASGTTSS